MSKLLCCVVVLLFIGACVAQNPCLYSSSSSKVLTPLVLLPNLCPNNLTQCMVYAYKYGNFQYNGPAALKPDKGEIVMFLAKYPDTAGTYHLVTMLNANVSTTMNVTLTKTDGTGPATIELYDDPIGSTDSWAWDFSTNTGKFQWVTLPTYTDGCIIGPMTFLDNYCIKAVFTQPNNAIQRISIMSGNSSSPQKILTAPYTSGSTFEFCQYPQTITYKKDVTCPGGSDGAANISISFGPSSATYSWVNSLGATIGTGQSISGLKAGTYTANVIDSSTNHCNAQRTVTISEPSAPYANVTTTPFACSTFGSASVTAGGGSGSGYTFVWKQGSTTIGTGTSISNLAMGTYTVTVSDSCSSVSTTTFTIGTVGCCGDGICQTSEACVNGGSCATDCGPCCPAGTYVSGSACIVCPAGSYSTTPGSTTCSSCPANTYNAGGNDACVACPANTQSSAGSGVCSNCAAGTVRATGESSCHSCGAGSVPSCAGVCGSCPAGTYAADSWSACQSCNAGTYSAAGAGSCTQCPAGKYAAAGATSCTACPSGTSPAGSSHLLACQ